MKLVMAPTAATAVILFPYLRELALHNPGIFILTVPGDKAQVLSVLLLPLYLFRSFVFSFFNSLFSLLSPGQLIGIAPDIGRSGSAGWSSGWSSA